MTPPPTAASPTNAPTSERGHMLPSYAVAPPIGFAGVAQGGAQQLYDTDEHLPELAWPNSLALYDRMVRSDARIAALVQSVKRLVMRRRFELDPSGAADEDVRRIAEDLGVPIAGSQDPPPVRGRGRFHHGEHLEQALLALRYGSYWFEIVGEIVDGAWRLRKLAPRPTRTLQAVEVDRSGGLEGILQTSRDATREPIRIPVSHLVGYVWEREGANWYGVSMLRPMYRSFRLKDEALRADAVQKRRNSLGIPEFTPGPDASQKQIDAYTAMGRKLGSGQEVSVTHADPAGRFELKGVSGSLPNPLESARYHDEEYAAAFIAMWMQLGQTQTGSRALGDTFLDVFNASLDAIADDWYCGVVNEYVIGKWMAYNYGDHDRSVPRLVSRRVESPELTPQDLALLVEKGIVRPSAELERHVNDTYDLPTADEEWASPVVVPGAPVVANPPALVAAGREQHVHAGALADGPTSRQRWRELTDREVRAAIDPEAMDERWRDAVTRIAAAWPALRDRQVEIIVEQVIESGADMRALINLSVPVVGIDVLHREMLGLAALSYEDVVREAAAQGARIPPANGPLRDRQLYERATFAAARLAKDLEASAVGAATSGVAQRMELEDRAAFVAASLRDLSNASLERYVGGAMTEAQDAGRTEAIEAGPTPATLVATEIMDGNTCQPCAQVDGKEYASLEEANEDYPTGYYRDCEGYDQCRGFVFAEYEAGS